MLKNLKLRASVSVIMLLVYVVSLPLMILLSYQVLLRNAEKESIERAQLMLTAVKAIREYVGGTIRPLAEDLAQGRQIVELSSGFFVVREISEIISESAKDYSFKFATMNPLNSVNMATDFEKAKINEFRTGSVSGEWRGFVKKSSGDAYVIMTPIQVDEGCLRCHGEPADAPSEQRQRYGAADGYRWKAGEVIGANTVYVPATAPIANARRVLVLFGVLYSVLFLIISVVIDRLIKSSVINPIERLVAAADEISRGKMDMAFDVTSNNEIGTLAEAFTRMKLSLAKAMDILKSK